MRDKKRWPRFEDLDVSLREILEHPESPEGCSVERADERVVSKAMTGTFKERLVLARQAIEELDTEIGIHGAIGAKRQGFFRKLDDNKDPCKVIGHPSDEANKLIEPISEFKARTIFHGKKLIETILCHREQIMEEIKHKEFFLDEFKKNQWNANPMLDRQRIAYSSQIDSLKRELRSLDIKLLEGLRTVEKDLLDADRELVPLKLF